MSRSTRNIRKGGRRKESIIAILIDSGDIGKKLDALTLLLKQQGNTILAKVDELLQELVTANEVTNEIANDVQDLLNRLAAGGLTPEEADQVKAKIFELTERLRGVASQHTTTP